MDQKDVKKYPVSSSEYKLYELVGEGVSAMVYRALCIPFNEIVAIKVLDLEKCNSNLDTICREVQTMSLINHPNVLKAHCSFAVHCSLWVVMPYMSGGSCLHIMKSAYPDGFEEKIIATFLHEVLKALEYLHSHGIIHRDVKAGNILVDGSGAVKLADFGVSACMFDTGDRQRSRNTFVGTPCWMAPEVMEQLHGYDFKADIWSFGITALELAHGHAPFSKYPPMKVLLMILQNAPPGLDYKRDRKFSKSFREMVSMCLVKDPKKRPSAEKALKHRFFKHACSHDFVARTVLDGLSPLGDRFRKLKLNELDRLAQRKVAYGEKEESSQSKYMQGISAWNFDLEDLKAQAALIPDDGKIPPTKEQKPNLKPGETSEELIMVPSYSKSPVMVHSVGVKSVEEAGDHIMQVQPGTVPCPLPLQSVNALKKCFDVYEDDINADSPTYKECIKSEHSRLKAIKTQQKDVMEYIRDERHDLEKQHEIMEDMKEASVPVCKILVGPRMPEHVLPSYRGAPGDGDRKYNHKDGCLCAVCIARRRRHERETNARLAKNQSTMADADLLGKTKKEASELLEKPFSDKGVTKLDYSVEMNVIFQPDEQGDEPKVEVQEQEEGEIQEQEEEEAHNKKGRFTNWMHQQEENELLVQEEEEVQLQKKKESRMQEEEEAHQQDEKASLTQLKDEKQQKQLKELQMQQEYEGQHQQVKEGHGQEEEETHQQEGEIQEEGECGRHCPTDYEIPLQFASPSIMQMCEALFASNHYSAWNRAHSLSYKPSVTFSENPILATISTFME